MWQTLKRKLKYTKIDFTKSAIKTNSKFHSNWANKMLNSLFYATIKHMTDLEHITPSIFGQFWGLLEIHPSSWTKTNHQAHETFVSFLKQFDSYPKWQFINSQNKSSSLSSSKIFPSQNTYKFKTYKICTLKWVGSCCPFLHEIIAGLLTADIKQLTPTSTENLFERKKATWFSTYCRLQEQLRQLILQRESKRIYKFQNIKS